MLREENAEWHRLGLVNEARGSRRVGTFDCRLGFEDAINPIGLQASIQGDLK